jgi:hypothetical protein
MLPVSRCRSLLSGHSTTSDTRRQFQSTQPCTVSADCTASNGWQPKHTHVTVERGQTQTVQHVALSTEAKQSVPQQSDIVLCYI